MSTEELLERITPRNLTIALGLVSLGTMIMVLAALHRTTSPLPSPGPPPLRPDSATVTTYRYLPAFYLSLVEEDAEKAGLAPSKPGDLARPQRYRLEFDGRHPLRPGAVLQTRTIRLRARRRKMWVGEEGHRFRTPHLSLRITNRQPQPIAYRVVTSVTGKCRNKAALAHNALALRPKQTIERTECLWRKGTRLHVLRIAVLELTPLGYHYVSRVDPQLVGFDTRTSAGHQPAKLTACSFLPWQTIERGLSDDQLRWYDVMDFYSRHNCDEYAFLSGYRWSERGPGPLPAKPPRPQVRGR